MYLCDFPDDIETYLVCNIAALADAIFALNIPVVLVLQGGRPFAIPDYYSQAAAVLNTASYLLNEI